jgi:tetratricopeptide (TPR) repeat protein
MVRNWPRSDQFWKFAICAILFVGTLVVYAPVRHYEFINYDDDAYVSDNPRVLGGLTGANVAWAFSRFSAANWHPLTWLSHMLDVRIWGVNAGGHHLTNAVLHSLNATLLFLVLSGMTSAQWRSAFVAAVFAWHPLHVESVAWISERKDLLCGFFWIVTVGVYQRYVRRPTSWRYIIVVGSFVLGLMSKPMMVTLPFVLLLLDWWPLERAKLKWEERRKWYSLIAEKVPLGVFALLCCYLTLLAQHGSGATRTITEVPSSLRLENAIVSYATYIWQAIWPIGLACCYALPRFIAPWHVALCALSLVVITVWAIRRSQPQPYALVGWLWYLGTLVPVIGIIQVGDQARADRYMYLPLIGLTVAVTWTVWDIIRGKEKSHMVASFFLILPCTLMINLTHRQLQYWQNSFTLFNHALAVTSDNYIIENNLSNAILAHAGDLEESKQHALEALRLRPNYPQAHLNLGLALLRQGKVPDAIPQLQKARDLQPRWPDAYFNLGSALMLTGQKDEAIVCFRKTLDLRPDVVYALKALAWIRATDPSSDLRNASEAMKLSEQAAKLTNYNDPEILDVLGASLAESGRYDDAIKAAESARELASRSGNNALAREIANRVDLYRLNLPYRARGPQ